MVYTVYVSNRGHDCGQKTVCCVRSKQFFGMKKIQLGGHHKSSRIHGYALVDDEDFEELNKHKWYAIKDHNTYYAIRHDKRDPNTLERKSVRMHRILLNAPSNMVVDHINGNGLDNRRSNIRLCTQSQNAFNQRKNIKNVSGYKGVGWHKQRKKWRAQIRINKKRIDIGHFSTPKLAHEAYIEAAKKYHGDFANCG